MARARKMKFGSVTVSDIDIAHGLPEARYDAKKAGVKLKLESKKGSGGWPTVKISGSLNDVKRLLADWGYEDEFDQELHGGIIF